MIFKSFGLLIFFTFVISYSYTSLENPGIPKYDKMQFWVKQEKILDFAEFVLFGQK